MSKVFLDSDFVHKDYIKENGGKWCRMNKQWYLVDPTQETLDKILAYGCKTYWSNHRLIYPTIGVATGKFTLSSKYINHDMFIDD